MLGASRHQPDRARHCEVAQQALQRGVARDHLVQSVRQDPEGPPRRLRIGRFELCDGRQATPHVVFESLSRPGVLRGGPRCGCERLPGPKRRLQMAQERPSAVAGVARPEAMVEKPAVPRLVVGRGERRHEHRLAGPRPSGDPAESRRVDLVGRSALEPVLGHAQLIGSPDHLLGQAACFLQEVVPGEAHRIVAHNSGATLGVQVKQLPEPLDGRLVQHVRVSLVSPERREGERVPTAPRVDLGCGLARTLSQDAVSIDKLNGAEASNGPQRKRGRRTHQPGPILASYEDGGVEAGRRQHVDEAPRVAALSGDGIHPDGDCEHRAKQLLKTR